MKHSAFAAGCFLCVSVMPERYFLRYSLVAGRFRFYIGVDMKNCLERRLGLLFFIKQAGFS